MFFVLELDFALIACQTDEERTHIFPSRCINITRTLHETVMN